VFLRLVPLPRDAARAGLRPGAGGPAENKRWDCRPARRERFYAGKGRGLREASPGPGDTPSAAAGLRDAGAGRTAAAHARSDPLVPDHWPHPAGPAAGGPATARTLPAMPRRHLASER